MKVIGISAKARHGKDFLANVIFNIAELKHQQKALIWSFAHPLKARVYGEARGELSYEDIWETKPAGVRERLQKAGTELGRDVYGEDFWMLQSEAFIRCFEKSDVQLVIIPDVRFLNEVVFCQLGGRAASRFDEECWERARKALEYEAWEKHYLDRGDIDSLTTIDEEVTTLQSMLYTAQLGAGRVIRILSDRPTLTGDAARHPSETSLDAVADGVFDLTITNNVDTTVDQLIEQLTPMLESYLGV